MLPVLALLVLAGLVYLWRRPSGFGAGLLAGFIIFGAIALHQLALNGLLQLDVEILKARVASLAVRGRGLQGEHATFFGRVRAAGRWGRGWRGREPAGRGGGARGVWFFCRARACPCRAKGATWREDTRLLGHTRLFKSDLLNPQKTENYSRRRALLGRASRKNLSRRTSWRSICASSAAWLKSSELPAASSPLAMNSLTMRW